jgi:hypothetical protein
LLSQYNQQNKMLVQYIPLGYKWSFKKVTQQAREPFDKWNKKLTNTTTRGKIKEIIFFMISPKHVPNLSSLSPY